MFAQLAKLECGIFLMAREDLDVARLLRVATVLRRITDALVMAHDFHELAAIAERVLPDVLPVSSLELFAETADEGLLRFSADDDFLGTRCGTVEPLGHNRDVRHPRRGPTRPDRDRAQPRRRPDQQSSARCSPGSPHRYGWP